MTWRMWPFMRSAHATGEGGRSRVTTVHQPCEGQKHKVRRRKGGTYPFSHLYGHILAIEQLPVVAAAH
jgi:hypothetical protein